MPDKNRADGAVKSVGAASAKPSRLAEFGRRLNQIASNCQIFFAVAAILIMTALVFVQIILRSVFSISNAGMEELARMLMLWAGMIGCAIATQRKFHVTCDILAVVVKNERVTRRVEIGMEFLCLVCSLVFAYWSYEYLASGIEFHKITRDLLLPTYWVDAAFLVSGSLMAIYFFLNLVRDIINLNSRPA